MAQRGRTLQKLIGSVLFNDISVIMMAYHHALRVSVLINLKWLETKTRADKHRYRSVQANELAAAINDILPNLGRSKNGTLPKIALCRSLI